MRVALLTREYPPDVYGGAGVHVEYLARELRNLIEVDVHAWGADRAGAIGHEAWDALAGPAPELAALRSLGGRDCHAPRQVQRSAETHRVAKETASRDRFHGPLQ